ncbi:MAG: cytochrome ubiquinol oxidase subunit I, partial [Solirubrobacteraceae bacterium]
GRQPWVVYRVMTTAQSVTGAGGIPVGYAGLVVTYAAVAAALVWILRRLAGAPLDDTGSEAPPGRAAQPA